MFGEDVAKGLRVIGGLRLAGALGHAPDLSEM